MLSASRGACLVSPSCESSANAMGMFITLGIKSIPGTLIVFNPSDIVGMFNAFTSLTIVTAFSAVADSLNVLTFTRTAFAFVGASIGLTLIDVLRNESNNESNNDCSIMGGIRPS